jgi:hypothetical protein
MRDFAPGALGLGSVLLLVGILGVVLGDPFGESFSAADALDRGRLNQWWHPYAATVHHEWSVIFGTFGALGLLGVAAGIWSIRKTAAA